MNGFRACASCLHFEPTQEGSGQCRRYAPMTDDSPSVGHWPTVRSTDYCGEFWAIPAPVPPHVLKRMLKRLTR